MSSLSEALRRHGPEYLRQLKMTSGNVAIRKAFAAIIRCRSGALGGVRWQCGSCNREHWAGRSCGNRHCATCGSEKATGWLVKQQGKLLPGVHHFMITFTVPSELRQVLRVYRRAGYDALMEASAQALRDVASATRALVDCKLGFFGVLHTWGRDPMVYHPHVHYVVPGGGVSVDKNGRATGWKQTPTNFFVPHKTLVRVYKAKLADQLRARGLYNRVPAAAWRKTFVVDIKPVDSGRSAVAYLAPYVHRVAISNHRIRRVDANSVTYQYQPSKSKRLKTRTVTGKQFATGFAQHILPTGFRKVRYHGWMASNSKVSIEEARMLMWFSLGWVYWMASGHEPRQKPPRLATLRCAVCGGPMRVVCISEWTLVAAIADRALAYLDSG